MNYSDLVLKFSQLLGVELWSHKFFKSFDDSSLVGEIQPNDIIAFYELPCHARQSKARKREPTDPFISPVYLSEANSRTMNTSFAKQTLFSYPSIVVIDPETAKSAAGIYDAVVDRLKRWASSPNELFSWRTAQDVAINISAPVDSLTEIGEDGVVTMQEVPTEGDISDERAAMVLDEEQDTAVPPSDAPLVLVGTKKEIFTFRVQPNFGDTVVGSTYNNRFDSWEERVEAGGSILKEGDNLYCDFDENMRAFYFGDSISNENYTGWTEYVHPSYLESRTRAEQESKRGLSLQDCLDEFTKEEQLGEEDLWYCPSCKKHQQATKKFDLWKTPDVLVVHLKRFSNSRALRDKIDEHIEFPVKGLDLTPMVGERAVAKKLTEQGIDTSELGLHDQDESLLYDLFAVDEHLGGLGGGHYRAYAQHHVQDQWYHFDDNMVTPADAKDSVVGVFFFLYARNLTG
jgi:ubiquitin carboxyl-terminal hydrolase 4/11